MDLGSLYFKIDADTGQVTVASNELNKLEASSKKAEMSTDKLGNSIKKTDADLGRFIDKSGKMREANGKFVKTTNDAAESVKNLGEKTKKTSESLAGLKTEISDSGDQLKSAAGYAVAFAASISAIATVAASAGKELNNMAKLSGVSVEEFQRLAFAASSAGVSAEKLGDIYKDVQDKIGDFLSTGGGELADYFEIIAPKIGQTSEEFRNLSGPQALGLFQKGLEDANLTAAEQIFYLESIANDTSLLTPLLANNGKGFAESAKRAGELNVVLSKFQVDQLVSVSREFNELSTVISRGAQSIVADNAEDIIKAIKSIAEAVSSATEFLKDNMDTISTVASIVGLAAGAYYVYRGAVIAATAAQTAFNLAAKASPIARVVTVLGGAVGLMLSFASETQKAAEAIATLTDKSGEFNDAQKEAARLNLIAEEIKLEKEITKLKAEQAKNKYPGIENLPEHMKTLHGVNDEWSGVNGKLTIAEQKLAKIRERIKEFGNLQITIDSGAGQDSEQPEELPLYDYDLYYSARIEATREYNEELAALLGTYQKTEKPLDRLKKDQARLNELMLIAGEKDAPKLKAALEEIKDQIEALATNKINWESIGTTAATSITDAIRSGDWQNVAGDIAQSAGMAIGTAVAGPIGGIVGSAIGAELFKAVEIADTYKNNQLLQGTGTVFGDSAAKTESILKSSEITASATQNLVGINRDMLTAMQTLNRGITGASGLIGRDVPTGFGELGSVQSIDLLGAGWATEKITNALLGGSSKVTDEGIKILGGTLDDIINTTTATAFAEVKTKKNRWASTKTSVQSRSVGSAVEQQLDLVFGDIFAAVEASATALGMSGNKIGDTLSAFVVDSFDISLKGMDADQRTEALQNVFSKVFDNLSNAVVPFLDEFQQSGEGAGETMSRLAAQLQITQRATQMLGNEVSQLGTRDAVYMSDYLIKAAGSMGQLTSQVQSFVDNFYSDEERLALALKDLRAEFSELGMTLPANKDGFKALVQSMDESTEAGAANLATLLRIQGAASDYYDLLERTADVQQKITDAQDTVRAAFELFQSQSSALKTSLLELVSNEAALAYQRETELEALDPLLRETQKRVWALQDEKARMEEAAKAGEKYRNTVKSSLDFINGTFASIESFTLGLRGGSSAAASSTYRSTLMAAQSGDRAALTGLPSSAQAFLDEQMKSARSLDEYNRSVERVIADLEGIQSAMSPEEFLAKEIAASLKETGETLKQQLEKLPDQLQGVIEKSKYEIDVLMDLAVNDASLDSDLRTLLIKTVDGATATIDLIANDDSIPDNYKKMILQQQIDANAAISAALTSDTDATIKRAIVDGQIATSATINAAIGANTDERIKTMVINGALSSAATIDAALSTSIDASTKALIVSKQKDYKVMLQAALSASSTEDALTIIQSTDEINKLVTLRAAGGTLTEAQQKLLDAKSSEILKSVDAQISANSNNDAKKIALLDAKTALVNVIAETLDSSTDAGKLALMAENNIKTLVSAAAGIVDHDSKSLALKTANNITTTVSAIESSAMDDEAKAVALNKVNDITSTVNAVLSSDLNAEAKKLALNEQNTLITNVNAEIDKDSESDAIWLAFNQSSQLIKTVKAEGGSLSDSQITLLKSESSTIKKLIEASGSLTTDQKTVLTAASDKIIKTLELSGGEIKDYQQTVLDATSETINKTLALSGGYWTSSQRAILEATTETITKTIESASSGILTLNQLKVLNAETETIVKTIEASGGTLTLEQAELLNQVSSTIVKTIEASGGNLTYEQLTLINSTSNDIVKTLKATGGDLTQDQTYLLSQVSSTISKYITANGGSLTTDQRAVLTAVSDTISKNISASGGSLTPNQKSVLTSTNGTIDKTIKASGGSLTTEQKTILDAINSVTEASVRADIALGDTAAGDLSSISEDATKQLGSIDLLRSKTQEQINQLINLNSNMSGLNTSITKLVAINEEDARNIKIAADARGEIAKYQSQITTKNDYLTSTAAIHQKNIDAQAEKQQYYRDLGKGVDVDNGISEAASFLSKYGLGLNHTQAEDYAKGLGYTGHKAGLVAHAYSKMASEAKLAALQQSTANTIASINALIAAQQNLIPAGYSQGGYTGSGGISEPAGIVHKGEYVVSQSMISKLGGNQFINEMEMIRRGGYVNGGLVGMSPISMAPQSTMDGGYLRAMTRTMSDMQNEIRALRGDQHNIGLRMLNNTRDTADMLESFNIIGLPPTRA